MTQMKHRESQVPTYLLWVAQKPSKGNKGKAAYVSAVKKAAAQEIPAPIRTSDIGVEVVYSTQLSKGIRLDIDNVLKPTLDALKGVAYVDDSQTRWVSATLIDRNQPGLLSGRVELVGRLLDRTKPDVVLVVIYSDERLRELGGKKLVAQKRMNSYLKGEKADKK